MYRLTLALGALIPLACSSAPIEAVPETDVVIAPGLSADVDVVRDEQGIPHIYGASLEDVAYAQAYFMGMDRFVEADLARRSAAGTLSEIAGDLDASIIDRDVGMRIHHLRKTSEDTFAALQLSSDPDAKLLVSTLHSYAAGMNAFIADLQSGRYTLPPALLLAYDPMTIPPWTEADSILIGRLISFQLSYDADSEIARTTLDAAGALQFDMSGDVQRAARKGIARDLQILEPVDPTYTFPGDFSTLQPISASLATVSDGNLLALLRADRPMVRDFGNDRWLHPDHGSNDWVIGPQLSATGHTLVANDPHLALNNPPVFYLNHLIVRGGSVPVDVFGGQFPGAPGVILGTNTHVGWGATTSNLDVTDVYKESVVTCDGSADPCAMSNGAKVALVPRVESFDVGRFGHIVRTVSLTFYDVPNHGPILPRVNATHDGLEALGTSELSVRWTGHEPSNEVLAVVGLDRAKSVKEAEAALEKSFKVGGQNWVLGDDQGHFGWTQTQRVPRRPAGTTPWKVLPGDGSADWLGDLDLRYIPHAFDPAAGFLATANADPIGVTDDGDPFASEPMVDGLPLYIGAGFDAGTRVGRITKRIQAMSAQKKLTVEDLQSIQADDVSEWDEKLAPTFLDAAQALIEEMAQSGTHPELTSTVGFADAPSKALVPVALDLVKSWTFDTPVDSRAAAMFNVWVTRFWDLVLVDETDILGVGIDAQSAEKLLVRLCTEPQKLATGFSANGDPILFDDLNTPEIEGKRQMAAKAIFDMIDYLIPVLGTDATTWTWGRLHTLTINGLLPLDAVRLPKVNDPDFANGYPRHGDNGTVDVGAHGLAVDDFTYGEGPALRAVYELDPAGVKAKNTIPGGEIFDPNSPHYQDLLQLWIKNQTFDELFKEEDVAASAKRELAAHGFGRVRFKPR